MTTKRRQPVELDIAGQTYRIASHYDAEYMARIADYLNDKIAFVKGGRANRSPQQALLLAALDVVDEYFKVKSAWRSEREKMQQTVDDTLQELDHILEKLPDTPGDMT